MRTVELNQDQFRLSLEAVRRGRQMDKLEGELRRSLSVKEFHLQLPVRGPGYFVVTVGDGCDVTMVREAWILRVQNIIAGC